MHGEHALPVEQADKLSHLLASFAPVCRTLPDLSILLARYCQTGKVFCNCKHLLLTLIFTELGDYPSAKVVILLYPVSWLIPI